MSLPQAVHELTQIDDQREGAIIANALNLYIRALHVRERWHFRPEDVRNVFVMVAHLLDTDSPPPSFHIGPNGGEARMPNEPHQR